MAGQLVPKGLADSSQPYHDSVHVPHQPINDGAHIRGPEPSGLDRPKEVQIGQMAYEGFGRRKSDLSAENIVTKKLVVISVILVEILALCGDILIRGYSTCS